MLDPQSLEKRIGLGTIYEDERCRGTVGDSSSKGFNLKSFNLYGKAPNGCR